MSQTRRHLEYHPGTNPPSFTAVVEEVTEEAAEEAAISNSHAPTRVTFEVPTLNAENDDDEETDGYKKMMIKRLQMSADTKTQVKMSRTNIQARMRIQAKRR